MMAAPLFTALDADKDGSLTRENSYVLNLVHPEGEAADKAIQAIVAEYKSRFQQEAVLRVKSSACISF